MKRNIIINESQLLYIKENNGYVENNNVEVFNKEVRNFIYHLMTKDIASISDYWRVNGVKKKELFNSLLRNGAIESEGKEVKVPKKNFDRKIKRIYYELFNDEEPGIVISEEDGGGSDGGMSTFSVGGSYEQPIFGVQRRKIGNAK